MSVPCQETLQALHGIFFPNEQPDAEGILPNEGNVNILFQNLRTNGFMGATVDDEEASSSDDGQDGPWDEEDSDDESNRELEDDYSEISDDDNEPWTDSEDEYEPAPDEEESDEPGAVDVACQCNLWSSTASATFADGFMPFQYDLIGTAQEGGSVIEARVSVPEAIPISIGPDFV